MDAGTTDIIKTYDHGKDSRFFNCDLCHEPFFDDDVWRRLDDGKYYCVRCYYFEKYDLTR